MAVETFRRGGQRGEGVRVSARLIVLGRQGAGKGTQCARLAARLGVSHLSTGDLFRAEIATGSRLGRTLDCYVRNGELVPDETVLDVVAAALGSQRRRSAGYLLDGFPRTLAQGQALLEVLGAGAAELAVEIDVPAEIVAQRLAARRLCAGCGTTTSHCAAGPGGSCTTCGGPLERRADDHPDAIQRRLALYDQEALPLLLWLESRGLLVTVDGTGAEDEVHSRVFEAVAARIPAVQAEPTRSH